MKKVLIVDDATFMRMMLKNILIQEGYEVVAEAENGEQAVELYKEHKPDFVTMDITMPIKDGIQAVKEIKAYDRYAKIIMCSALGQEAKVKEAIIAGAVHFIVKPFKPESVISSIEKIFK